MMWKVKLMLPEREEMIEKIKSLIEHVFTGSIVRRTGTGCPDDDYSDNTEVFEAYMIEDEDLERFKDFVWKMNKEIAEPGGFSIMVHSLNPEDTNEYRLEHYNSERAKRITSKYITDKQERAFIKVAAKIAICAIASRTISDFSEMELTRVSVKPSWDENGKNGDKHSDAVRGTAISAESSIKVAS